MTVKTTEFNALTVAECAADLHVSSDLVVQWIEGGHLQAFVPPGKLIGSSKPGRKSFRIFREDWESFKHAHRMTGQPKPEGAEDAAPKPRRGVAAGTDGVSRLRAPRRRA